MLSPAAVFRSSTASLPETRKVDSSSRWMSRSGSSYSSASSPSSSSSRVSSDPSPAAAPPGPPRDQRSQRHQPRGPAVLVHHDGHVQLLGLELLEQGVGSLGF